MKIWILVIMFLVGCSSSDPFMVTKGLDNDFDASLDTDTDGDTDGDGDADMDTDTDTDVDTDTDSDTEVETETDSRTDSEIDTETVSVTDTDTDTGYIDFDGGVDGGTDGGLLVCPFISDGDMSVMCEDVSEDSCWDLGMVSLPGYGCAGSDEDCCITLTDNEPAFLPDAGPVDWCSNNLHMWCVEWPTGLTCEDLGGTSQPGFDSSCPVNQNCCEFPASYIYYPGSAP